MLKQSRNLLSLILLLAGLAGALSVQAEALPKPRVIANHLLDDIDQATWIAEGKGNRIVYIFFDPNCPYCHKLYGHLRSMVGKDDLQFRWIPVGMLTSTSLGKAAAILQSKNRLAAFYANENNFNFSDAGPGGGIKPVAVIEDKTKLDLASNLSLLQGQNLYAVPLTVFRAKDGQGLMFEGSPPPKTLHEFLQYVK
ncbi:MAG: thioredoxin fold domain-containing protein [Gammaproteobacteria bacterium]|jgi:thiol:disulfide interchange protein DsbG